MKKIVAYVKPETQEPILEALEKYKYISLTRNRVIGHGKQKGITLGSVRYEGFLKASITAIVEDEDVDDVVKIITKIANSGKFGDGKIFIMPIDEVVEVTF